MALSHATGYAIPTRQDGPAVRAWLWSLALLVFAMVVVGGATRLTDSGLSIAEWKPIVGMIPPLSNADWHDAFEKYKQIPQYQLLNKGMSLEAFKFIFWWEWAHRFLGRIIGFAFALPFAYFLLRRQISSWLMPRVLAIFAVGGLQGFIGWYMVKSGLTDNRLFVSHYRLALHLVIAFAIIAMITWTVLKLKEEDGRAIRLATVTSFQRFLAGLILALVFAQTMLGALVAGLRAGLSNNTWPLMDGRIIPDGLLAMTPWYENFVENVLTVQFQHRAVGYALALVCLVQALGLLVTADDERVRGSAALLLVACIGQAALGVWTVVSIVPLWLALAHQAGAVLLLLIAVWHLFEVRRAARAPA